MLQPKWLVVARNEYSIRINNLRAIRPYFPYLSIGLLSVYVWFVAPAIVNLFIDDFLAFILSQAAVAVVQIILFMLFFYMLIFPITNTLREVQTDQLEIYLASPLKPSDLLLGEFIGIMPFYTIAITVIAGFFTSLLNPLNLAYTQIAIIIVIFIITFFSALWIGTVIAAILRTRLGRAACGKDVGRFLGVIIALPLIALTYSIIGGGLLEVLADPGTNNIVKAVLGLFPSTWGAEIIIGFALNPGNLNAYFFETITRLGSLIFFFVAVLWVGVKTADRAYNLESTSFTSAIARQNSIFFNSIKYLGGGKSFGGLLTSIFKDYGRRLENISWLAYTVGLVALVSFFFGDGSFDPEDALFSTSLLMIPMLAGFAVGTVSRGKEKLFIYKKSALGISKFLKARLVQGWFVAVPIVAIVIIIRTILVPQSTTIFILNNLIMASLRTLANIAFSLGLTLLIPNLSDKSRDRTFNIIINMQIAIFTTIGLEIGLTKLGLNLTSLFPNLNNSLGYLYDHFQQTIIISFVSIVLVTLGKRKLRRIE